MSQRTSSLARLALLVAIVAQAGCKAEDEPIRILTGGIRHESNTFIPLPTTKSDFDVRRGRAALEGREWATFLRNARVQIIPTLHAGAPPFGIVARQTFDSFQKEILDRAREVGPVDGVFLDMHGALHAEGYDDAQVDFVRAVREIVGPGAVIAGSFDLHGNISPELAGELNILTAYRTAPHVDGAETRLRAVALLLDAIRERRRPEVAHVNVPILIPGEKGITAAEPLASLYASLPTIAGREGLIDASIFVGMPWTDVHRAGMSVQVVAADASTAALARAEVERLARQLWDARAELQFDVPTAEIDEAIQTALAAPESTVFITDSGDNTTAGAAGDGTLVLERLLAHDVPDAVLAGVVDPEAVAACVEAGVGGEVTLALGGKLDRIFSRPLDVTGTVRFIAPEPSPDSKRRPVVVEVGGVRLVVLNERRSFTAPGDFAEVGIEPLQHKIVVVKLGYLFQGLRDIAPRTIMALTPGFAYQIVENLEYERIRRPIYPIDREMDWSPSQ
jgi:microcystin degradation protein MlrC